jgi:hypothetical protein
MKTKRSLYVILLAVGLGLVWGAPAATVAIEGVAFDQAINVGDTMLELSNVGLLRYKVVFRAYVGALYLGPGASPEDFFAGRAAGRLELEYFWPIKGQDFADAAVPFLRDNMTEQEYRQIEERYRRLGEWYQDVKPGDRYALTFVPGVGTELALNGESMGVIEGDDFPGLYFRIWLGERPVDRRFRDQLLARR